MPGSRFLGEICFLLLFGLAMYFCIPKPDLYEKYSFSSAVYDRNGKLLQLALSMDDKYRLFVPAENIPQTAKDALLLYEDRHFYKHPGVNPFSLGRAFFSMAGGARRQGASTITMQVARLAFHIDSSTLWGKIKQILRAVQIELYYDKSEILEAYFNLAPYGGNIEGLGAASLVYFGKKACHLTLPEVLALTVIPQNPGKRNLLTPIGADEVKKAAERLKKIWKEHYKHPENDRLSLPLSFGVYLPRHAPHYVREALGKASGEVQTLLDLDYQKMAEETLKNYVLSRKKDGVQNAAALIVDTNTLAILAYVGSADFADYHILGQVDGTKALRSPGSALKPFIYVMALEQGIIHPLTMLKDVPKNYGLYTPENFDRSFYGLVNATEALVYSRNIPAVELLLRIGGENFYALLKKCGVKRLKSADFYGLAMALGGVEVSMQDLAAMYAMLNNRGNYSPLRLLASDEVNFRSVLSPEAAFLTLDMLAKNEEDGSRGMFVRHKRAFPVSWKTGTSYGFKDAWSAGIVGHYAVVVWVGNFDGTPNNAFVGREVAAPLFFRLVSKIAKAEKIPERLEPFAGLNLSKVQICQDTGDIANAFCEKKAESYFIPGVSSVKMSNVSRQIPIDVKTGLRACRHRPPLTEMKSYNFWPSDVLKAYARAGISLRRPPEFLEDCPFVDAPRQGMPPQISLPVHGRKFLLRSYKLADEKIVVKAALDADAKTVYWFINNNFAGQSKPEEALEISPVLGKMNVKAVDDYGRFSISEVEVILAD